MLRRTQQRRGLANPFASLYLLATAVLGPGSRFYGQVNMLVDFPLNDERLYPIDFKMHCDGKGANPQEHS
ncbi:Type III secretion system regulator (LcrR) [Photorhabdus australis subsp. thailandensis]|uniref:Type III secretion system regulator (LcrR) n=1 Tax=Photorhabdus australis subsp. thailandensis TaxID=2805096 RepID=A0A1C0U9L1_9GAMM|nr:Type III secretion system regulator (LcrR) [Photorhabdus australis subsp. thailandensis]